MKSKIIKLLLAVVCLLCSTSVSAYDFEVNGIYYNVVSLSEQTCEVTFGNSKYTGDVVIPATVNYGNRTLTVVGIYSDAFSGCSGLTSITIPNSIDNIGNNAFYGCSKLERVTIEDGERGLDVGYNYYNSRGLFYDCPITNLYFGRDLFYVIHQIFGELCDSPFSGITTLKEVTIGDSVTIIDDYAFSCCNSLTSVTIPNSVSIIGNHAFSNCDRLTSVTIPNSVSFIGSYVFHNCRGLKSVTIPNSVTYIYSCAFYGCSGLESVTIGNSVTEIGSSAFSNCSSLTSVTIPNSVTSISDFAFSWCSSLTTLYSLNTTPPRISSVAFNNNHYMTLNVYVPHEAWEAYQSAYVWKDFWNLQGFDPTGINAPLMNSGEKTIKAAYDLGGKQLSQPQRGLNIVKMSDGTTRKIAVK